MYLEYIFEGFSDVNPTISENILFKPMFLVTTNIALRMPETCDFISKIRSFRCAEEKNNPIIFGIS